VTHKPGHCGRTAFEILNASQPAAQRPSGRIHPHLHRGTASKIFQEQVSSIAERAELERALDYVRGGDTLVVTKVDRLARSTVGLWDIVKRLEAVEDGGAGLRVLNLGGETVDTKSATGKLILTIFPGFAQFEREMMLERQREGIAKAKAENRYLGRRPSARLKNDEAAKLFREGRTVTQIAAALSIGRGSVYRALEAAGMKWRLEEGRDALMWLVAGVDEILFSEAIEAEGALVFAKEPR
jgi:DNA invertase Pin-like site-specific DNA recombinase